MKERKTKINEKTMAAAIKYDSTSAESPKVTARGRGFIADKIISIAEENGIPIKNDPDLVQILSKLDVGTEIPVELYQAVAEILAFVYSLNENQRIKNN
jgi:flagellar biosynthesis protein